LKMVNHVLKKEKGKSHKFGYSGCTIKHHMPKGGLPWIRLRVPLKIEQKSYAAWQVIVIMVV